MCPQLVLFFLSLDKCYSIFIQFQIDILNVKLFQFLSPCFDDVPLVRTTLSFFKLICKKFKMF